MLCNYCFGFINKPQTSDSPSLSGTAICLSVDRCVVPEIVVEMPVLDFKRCFLNYPYHQQVRLTNPSTLPACYGVLDQVKYITAASKKTSLNITHHSFTRIMGRTMSFLGSVAWSRHETDFLIKYIFNVLFNAPAVAFITEYYYHLRPINQV